MTRTEEVTRMLASTIGVRPVGTKANNIALRYLAGVAQELRYDVTELPFESMRWEPGPSTLRLGDRIVPISPGPFSPPLRGSSPIESVSTLEALRRKDITDRFLVLRGALAEEPIMPKDFPFYYPDNHREIIDLLQSKRPAGIVALTGKHPMCGLNPFPLFEDGNLGIPNAYTVDSADFGVLNHDREAQIELESIVMPSTSRQLVFSRGAASEKRIVVCAHMDTKYETPGALDNAAGVATVVGVMERLRDTALPVALDIVLFNGEEYFGVPGQLAYLDYREPSADTVPLVINVDGVGHVHSRSALSYYNLPAAMEAYISGLVEKNSAADSGEQWIAGDHSIFAFRGIPCIAVTSSNLLETVLDLTHTAADTLDNIDFGLLDKTAGLIAEIVRSVVVSIAD